MVQAWFIWSVINYLKLCNTLTIHVYSIIPVARKLCVVRTKCAIFSSNAILTKGSLRTPVVYPERWCIQALSPSLHQQNVSTFHHSQGLEICLSTCTEPCTNKCLFDCQSWEPPSSPDNPMMNGDFIHP